MFLMLDKVISLICEELGCADSEVDENTLIGDLVSDELEIEELVQVLENEFEFEFGEELSGDISVAELAEMIEKES